MMSVWGPTTNHTPSDPLEGLLRFRHSCTHKYDNSKRTLNKGKQCIRPSVEDPDAGFQSSLSGGIGCHKEHTSPAVNYSRVLECLCLGKPA